MSTPSSSGPVLQLLASGLQRWIRSQCDSVEELNLSLQGSAFALFKGRLKGVTLQAKRVQFQQLPLARAELQSGELRASLRPGQPNQPVQFEEPFLISGEVVISGVELNQALASDRWRWLGDLLSERLMGLTPLRSLTIDNDILKLTADVITGNDPIRRSFRLNAEQGTIRVDHCDARKHADSNGSCDTDSRRPPQGRAALVEGNSQHSALGENRQPKGDGIKNDSGSEEIAVNAIQDSPMTWQDVAGILQPSIPLHHRFGEIAHKCEKRDKGAETSTHEPTEGPHQKPTSTGTDQDGGDETSISTLNRLAG